MISPVLARDLELRKKLKRDALFPPLRKKTGIRPVKEIMAGVGIREIARGIGSDYANISRIFSGKANPRLSTLQSIADFLSKVKGMEVTVNDVLDLMRYRPWENPVLSVYEAYRDAVD